MVGYDVEHLLLLRPAEIHILQVDPHVQAYAGVVYFHMLQSRLDSAGNLASKSLTNQLGVSNDAG